MKRTLLAAALGLVLFCAAGSSVQAGHKVYGYYYAPPSYYMVPPVVVYEPAFVMPAPYVIYPPAYTVPQVVGPVYHPPVYGPRRYEVRYPVWPKGELKVKYKRRWYGYKIEYDYDD